MFYVCRASKPFRRLRRFLAAPSIVALRSFSDNRALKAINIVFYCRIIVIMDPIAREIVRPTVSSVCQERSEGKVEVWPLALERHSSWRISL